MRYEDRFDSLIEYHAEKEFPECDRLLIKRQMLQESAAHVMAESRAGAKGLMQLMPATARELAVPDGEIFNAEFNLAAGINYLRIQYTHFPEIPEHAEKLKFSLASYNGGRGYVNRALELAYQEEHGEPMPPNHRGGLPGKWQTWEFAKPFLKSPRCTVGGRTPDWRQMTEYVERIWREYEIAASLRSSQ